MNLVSIDPGVRGCGCALWIDGVLYAAAYVAPAKAPSLPEAITAMVDAVHDWIPVGSELVIEFPQTYRGRAAKGDTNDLLAVAAVAGAIIALNGSGKFVSPHTWKGSVPKKTAAGVNIIKERCLKRLSPEEISKIRLPSKSLHHNVYDGVFLGLWWLEKHGQR